MTHLPASDDKEKQLLGGIYWATPPEALHALSKGLFEYQIQYLVSEMLTESSRNILDDIVQRFSFNLLHQSDRDIFRCHFPRGFTDLKKITGSEMNGLMFVLYISLQSNIAHESLNNLPKSSIKFTSSKMKEYTKLLQRMLCFLMWMKKEDGFNIDHQSYEKYQSAIRELLHDYKNVVQRDGNGLRIKKFHQILHLPFLLMLFGAFSNSDTGPCERLLKYLVKQPFRTTQKLCTLGKICLRNLFSHPPKPP